MKVLILGSGGREHAFAWKIHQSPLLTDLFVAPGNAGTAQIATNLLVNPTDFPAIKTAVLQHDIDMVLVGPEAPLVEGIHDYFLTEPELMHIPVIGPAREAATLEGSKQFAKEFMARHNIPTAAYRSFTSAAIDEAKTFLHTLTPPYVLKADGLAAGKGVLILDDIEEAKNELEAMLIEAKFGEASSTVVIEEFLDGIELSCFVLTDGKQYKVLPFAKDYKRIGEGDTGLNTGGMGAVSPVPFNDEMFRKKVLDRIVKPTIEGLQKENIPYVGFVFIGLIKVGEDPYVIEYNVRMGDPETEVVLPRIQSDLLAMLRDVTRGELDKHQLLLDPRYATTVMAVSGGYPGAYQKGKPIAGLDSTEGGEFFHAGTKKEGSDIVTNGGRVIAATGMGSTLHEALDVSYGKIKSLQFEGMYFRKDIGFDL